MSRNNKTPSADTLPTYGETRASVPLPLARPPLPLTGVIFKTPFKQYFLQNSSLITTARNNLTLFRAVSFIDTSLIAVSSGIMITYAKSLLSPLFLHQTQPPNEQ